MNAPASCPPRLLVAAGLVWLTPSRLLLQRRPSMAAHGAGRWEFPGGKVERAEAPAEALRRELREEWGPAASTLQVGQVADVVHHAYPPPEPEVVLVLYHVDGADWAHRWRARATPEHGAVLDAFDVDALPISEFLSADQGVARRLRAQELRPPLF